MNRRTSRQVSVGNIKIGGNAPVCVQSMLNVRADNIEGNVKQAVELEKAGCQIIRTAVPDMEAAKNLIPALKSAVSVPIVADIHFDYRLALESAAAGVDKIRINPGNIGADEHVKEVADVCRNKGIPIRIGVNSGSVEKEILAKYGAPRLRRRWRRARCITSSFLKNLILTISLFLLNHQTPVVWLKLMKP